MTLKEMVKKRKELLDTIVADEARTGCLNLNYRADRGLLVWKIADEAKRLYNAGDLESPKLQSMIECFIAIGKKENTRGNAREYEHYAELIAEEVERIYLGVGE